ncbi:MAG TPA: hydrogenase maturation nickel metallochaperone HypA [Myxococcales bacterium]|nr:hydrogenase maturation nickel metallochaperone HypA [Myxococcales bacterium]
MHEYSVVQALIGRVEREAAARGATQVHKLRVSLGELSGVEPALLATAYETFKARTICADAVLDLRKVEAAWACKRCEMAISRGAPLRCTICGEPARLLHGDELVLESIDMEVP